MSFSNPQPKNPSTRFMQWRGGEEGGGRLTWYDKEAQQENEIKLPFSFIVLDELTTLTGFNDNIKQGYWSNEVRNSNDTLVLRNKNGMVDRGTYQEIKAKNHSGMKFAQSVYVAFKDESGELVIGNIKLFGAAFSAWIDFKKRFDIEKCAVFITDEPKAAKKGSNRYFVPVFDGQNISEDTRKQVNILDEQLQAYLNTYLQRKPEADDADIEEVDDEPAGVEIEDVEVKDGKTVPVENETPSEPAAEAPKKDDGKINLKDVPF